MIFLTTTEMIFRKTACYVISLLGLMLLVASCGQPTASPAPAVFSTAQPTFTAITAIAETKATTGSPQTSFGTITSITTTVQPLLSPVLTTLPVATGVDTRWLTKKPCAPPCFENIIPGVSTMTETLTLLRSNPEIINIDVINSKDITPNVPIKDSTREGTINWQWNNHPPERSAFNSAATASFNQDGKIDALEFYPERTIVYMMADIIDQYGEPTHIMAGFYPHVHGDYYTIDLVYLNHGFLVERYYSQIKEIKTKPVLNPQLKFTDPVFFSPGLANFDLVFLNGSKYLVKWQGWQEYTFYCRNAYSLESTPAAEFYCK